MNIGEKIQKILKHNAKRWEGMTKEALIHEIYHDYWEYLDNEVDQGNMEYIDELLEEIDEEEL